MGISRYNEQSSALWTSQINLEVWLPSMSRSLLVPLPFPIPNQRTQCDTDTLLDMKMFMYIIGALLYSHSPALGVALSIIWIKRYNPPQEQTVRKTVWLPTLSWFFPECPLKVHIPQEVNSPSYAPWFNGHLTTEVILCFWLCSLCYCPEMWELEPKQYIQRERQHVFSEGKNQQVPCSMLINAIICWGMRAPHQWPSFPLATAPAIPLKLILLHFPCPQLPGLSFAWWEGPRQETNTSYHLTMQSSAGSLVSTSLLSRLLFPLPFLTCFPSLL